MTWSHPDISLEDLLKLVKGFVDILILASGHQSSGRPAHWDSDNIKKAFQWALFFEDVFSRLSCTSCYQESIEELDAALSRLTSDPYFPQGLAHLSSVTLSRSRSFILKHFIHALPLMDARVRALLTAAIEMDLHELQVAENDPLHIYLEKLTMQNASRSPIPAGECFMENSTTSFSDGIAIKRAENPGNVDFTMLTSQEILRRHLAVSCTSSAETGLEIITKTIGQSNRFDLDYGVYKLQLKDAKTSVTEEQFIEPVLWNNWRTKTLSYFLEKRTIRLVSGASMVFSAPKVQWMQMFARLDNSKETRDEDLLEIIELLLLGFTVNKWSSLIEHFMSVSYDTPTVSMLHNEVCQILQGTCLDLYSKEEIINLKEKGILEHLEVLLSSRLYLLWKLSPALAAVAIPSWSLLFRMYVSELDSQYKGLSSLLSCCNCIQDKRSHRDCVVAERFWCLYIFHAGGPHRMHGVKVA